MNVLERFLKYVKIDTQSDEVTGTSPSTMKQHDLAKLLLEELEDMGAQEIYYDKAHCYVYATIPASKGFENKPVIGFIAHMDTAPAMSGTDVKPRIIEKYDGKDILLNASPEIFLKTADFPEILKYIGQDLVLTDGTTLLGADDKAGIAEIMTMADYLLNHPECEHGKIRICFTPDEEIGCGPDYFDVKLFGADYAYTVDGGALGELEFENFNAAGAKVTINGRNVHPGSAKGKMKNAILIAQEFQSMLPKNENPMYTEGYEGFYHLDAIEGTVECTKMDYIIRDHDRVKFENKKKLFCQIADFLNSKYGESTIEVDMKDSYFNMREKIEPYMFLIEYAKDAMEELDIKPIITPIRGGTDGARLSFMGLPCPNLCTGGENFHGRYEYISVQAMERVWEMLVKLVTTFV